MRISLLRTCLGLTVLACALAACNGDDVGPTSPVTIALVPDRASLAVGASQTLTAQISGGGGGALPALATCVTGNVAVATATRSGNGCAVTGVAIGSTSLTAALASGASATAEITVTPALPALTGLFVAPAPTSLVVNDSAALDVRAQVASPAVTVTYTYQSQSPAIVAVSASGVVRALSAGTAVIQATAVGRGAGFTESTLSQSIGITVRTRTAGLSDLTAALASGPATGPATLITGESRRIVVSALGPLAANATYSVTSSAPAVATANANLIVTALGAGTATLEVTASVPQIGDFAATSITRPIVVSVQSPAPFSGFSVSPSTTQPLVAGATVPLNATYTAASGATVNVSHSSNAPGIATVNANGLVTAVGPGSANITTTVSGAGNGFASLTESRVTTITVLDRTPGLVSLTVTPSTAERYVGQGIVLSPAINGPSVGLVTRTFTSDRPNVATVRNDGVVTAVGPGTANILISAAVPQNGAYAATTLNAIVSVTVRTGVRSIAITQTVLSVPVGQNRSITALVSADAGINTAVQFVSRNPSVASVAANGIVTGVAGGTTFVLVRAVADTMVVDSTNVTVVNNCAAPRTVAFGEIVTARVDAFSCQGDRQLYRFTAAAQTEVRFAFSQIDAPLTLAPLAGPLLANAWEQSSVIAGSNLYALVPAGAWSFAVRSAASPNNFTFSFLTANTLSCADYVTAFGIAIHPVQLYANCLRSGGYHARRFYFAPKLAANDLITLRVRAPGFPVRIDLFDESGALLATSAASAADAEAALTYRADIARVVWAEVSNRAQPAALGPMVVSFTGPRLDGVAR